MNPNSTAIPQIRVSVVLGFAVLLLIAAPQEPGGVEAPSMDERLARGRHLVHEVAHCIQCHTPRDASGDLIEIRLLQGAPILVDPPGWVGDDWAFRAPYIAGLPGYSDEQAVRLLTQGLDPSSSEPRSPMPPFRMSLEEALDVVAYLRSLE